MNLAIVSSCSVAKSCQTLCDPMDCTRQAPLSMGFSREEYWGGLSFPSPGDLLEPGVEPLSPALASKFFTTEPSGKPYGCFCDKTTEVNNSNRDHVTHTAKNVYFLAFYRKKNCQPLNWNPVFPTCSVPLGKYIISSSFPFVFAKFRW